MRLECSGIFANAGSSDLTVEALILEPKYQELFTYEEPQIVRDRLKEYGFEK